MNISKFTQKSVEAVQNCEKLAYEYGNQEIEEEHLLYSLLTIEDSPVSYTHLDVYKRQIPRYATIGQDCGSAQHGTIRRHQGRGLLPPTS